MKSFWTTIILACLLSIIAATAVDILISTRIPIIGKHIGLTYSLNPGIAWGIQLPRGIQEIMILGALAAVAHMARSAKTTVSIQAYALIIGGGMANVIDRLRDGYVTDFVQIGTFPIFNVADSFVCIGVGMLLIEAVFPKILAFQSRK
ncbi:signal peptidase II [Candidatus Peregrinibacteria bacterium]|jgi:signal peptidase II|nr:signal peptidase II [Candidatus Peregrinibacteria bacterium]MBT5468511.1 signal peptidase II [Candidatus Peregrinibacteria bacterium]MBT7337188.1 signal peptidase II [Candidatus Peregrinibacteria bacterium]